MPTSTNLQVNTRNNRELKFFHLFTNTTQQHYNTFNIYNKNQFIILKASGATDRSDKKCCKYRGDGGKKVFFGG